MSLSIAHRKAAQALNYFARQEGGSINKLKALKLLFFADRYHLRKFGRPVSECTYFAMAHGPVASEAKNIAEGGRPVARTRASLFPQIRPQER
jgi:uncharacterized phage-associated protein